MIGKHIHPLETGGDTLHHPTEGKVAESFDHSDGQKHKYSEKADFSPANKGNKTQQRETKGGGTQTRHKPHSALRAINHSQQHTEKYEALCFTGNFYMLFLFPAFLLQS